MKRIVCGICMLFLLMSAPAMAAEKAHVRALGTNGEVTVGIRTTPGAGGIETNGTDTWEKDLFELVYTTDGVHWSVGAWDWELNEAPIRGGYNGREFLAYRSFGHLPAYRSADGIHWTQIPENPKEDIPTVVPGIARLGPYQFELADGELWLVTEEQGLAALLPDMGKTARKGEYEVQYADIVAYYVPDGVRVECRQSGLWGNPDENPFIITYPTSSLDWVTENQSTHPLWSETVQEGNNGSVYIRTRNLGNSGERWEVCTDGEWRHSPDSWKPIAACWSQDMGFSTLLPWNGKTFLILDGCSLQLYASENGVDWRCLRDTFLAPERYGWPAYWQINYSQHVLTWTGSEYLSARRTAEGRYGMLGMSGGTWASPYCTKICFSDGDFNLTGEYDFGRQVISVGYWDGVYYAEVSRSEGILDGHFMGETRSTDYDRLAGTDIYRSTDKVNWEKTELKQIFSSIQTWSNMWK